MEEIVEVSIFYPERILIINKIIDKNKKMYRVRLKYENYYIWYRRNI